jgi:hypothetical protein
LTPRDVVSREERKVIMLEDVAASIISCSKLVISAASIKATITLSTVKSEKKRLEMN